MNRLLSMLLVTLLLISTMGCASRQQSGALIGAGGGAAAGAGIGALLGGKKGALIGGAVGAAAGGITGAAIGDYMDRQEAALRQKVKNANIVRRGDELVVQFESGLLFDTGRADLKYTAQTELEKFSTVIKDFPETELIVEGHTDSTGSDDLNKMLSANRAGSVSQFLVAKGVEQQRLTPIGYGEERLLINPDTTEEARQQNRRVEVKIKPNEKMMKAAE